MLRILASTLLAAVVFHSVSIESARGDVIRLDNGDTINATLIRITESSLKIRHEIFGELEIPRERVRAIILGDAPQGGGGDVVEEGELETEPETPKEVIDRLVNPDFGPDVVKELTAGAKRQSSPEDVIEQLRREGVDSQLKDRLHLMLPGFGAPEVQGYFNDTVGGLISGSVTIQDVRDDAIDARDQLKEIMDDLGPDAVALRGYYGILDNFIQKTDPKKTGANRPAPAKEPRPIPTKKVEPRQEGRAQQPGAQQPGAQQPGAQHQEADESSLP